MADRNIISADFSEIRGLIIKSRASERKRALHLVRSSHVENPGIMFNCLQPGTYVRPHMHPQEDGKEILIALQGSLKAVIFDTLGCVTKTYDISPQKTVFIEIPSKTYHSSVAMEKDSVVCELYLGYYREESYKSFAPWAPAEENKEEAGRYLEELLGKINR